MPAPTITISTPTSGGTVARTFTASGGYTSPTTPTINVELRDPGGATVASTTATLVGRGNWTADLTSPQAYSGASVFAEIVGTAATDSVGNITVT